MLGQTISDPAAYLPQVGALIEGPAFYPALSARRNLSRGVSTSAWFTSAGWAALGTGFANLLLATLDWGLLGALLALLLRSPAAAVGDPRWRGRRSDQVRAPGWERR